MKRILLTSFFACVAVFCAVVFVILVTARLYVPIGDPPSIFLPRPDYYLMIVAVSVAGVVFVLCGVGALYTGFQSKFALHAVRKFAFALYTVLFIISLFFTMIFSTAHDVTNKLYSMDIWGMYFPEIKFQNNLMLAFWWVALVTSLAVMVYILVTHFRRKSCEGDA